MTTYYAGIGARSITPEAIKTVQMLSRVFSGLGFILRSGGANGADDAWESAYMMPPHDRNKQIFLPWGGFNGRSYAEMGVVNPSPDKWEEAFSLTAAHHPNWAACSHGARKLHARNCFQIFGADLKTPASFVVAWTENGLVKGGTGQTIRLAQSAGIPVYNLGLDDKDRKTNRNVLSQIMKEVIPPSSSMPHRISFRQSA